MLFWGNYRTDAVIVIDIVVVDIAIIIEIIYISITAREGRPNKT